MEDLSADSWILACKIIFLEYGLPRKIMSDEGSNFISEKFETFCKTLSIECAKSSSFHHQSNGQVQTCIKLVKCTMKKCCDIKSDLHLTLCYRSEQNHYVQGYPALQHNYLFAPQGV